MKTIKFRRPFYKGNIFSHFAFFEIIPGNPIMIGNVKWGALPKEDELFSGLKDEKGIEIFEGDVVELFGDRFTIVFKHGSFYHKDQNREAYGSLGETNPPYKDDDIARYYKVIGNIHEGTVNHPTLYGNEHPHP